MRNLRTLTLCATLLATSAMAESRASSKVDPSSYNPSATVNYYDPMESFNRKIYAFNHAIDQAFIIPMTEAYRKAVPETGRKGVRNFFRNLMSPVAMLNNLLQGSVEGAFTTFWRFALNTTFGVGGLGDFASDYANLKPFDNDFGRTLGVYGAGPGAYLVLPILGPSNARDAVGLIADTLSDPTNYLRTEVVVPKNAVYGIDKREALLDVGYDIEKNALDPYVALRSMYLQNRSKLVERSNKRAFQLPSTEVTP